MNENTLDLVLGDDPDAIEAHAYSLLHQGPHSDQYDQARTLVQLAKGYRHYSDFEVPGGPLAVQRQADRLIETVKWLFHNELDSNIARRLTRAMFVLDHISPGEPSHNLLLYLLLEHVSGKTRQPCQ